MLVWKVVLVYLIKAMDDMANIYYWVHVLVYLMKDIVAEQFYQVPVTGLRPVRIHFEPFLMVGKLAYTTRHNTYSGRSLMNPSLHIRRTNLPFCISLVISVLRKSECLLQLSVGVYSEETPPMHLRVRAAELSHNSWGYH